jgi:hypothetical protein
MSALDPKRDDRIFLATRLVAVLVVPILVLAWVILYFFPDTSAASFAWEIQPPMMAAFMGAGYLGGALLFVHAALGRRWHRVAAGFPIVAVFTAAMLLVTVLHWARFDLQHFPFLLWLVLYLVTPVLIPWLWWRNRATDPGTLEERDRIVPAVARWSLGLLGLILWGFALAGFLRPNWLVSIWVWSLTPLTARVLSGWLALLGTGGLVIGRETRWSAWRVGIQSIGLWHILVILGAWRHPLDFPDGLINWYTISVILTLLGMAGLYLYMETSSLANSQNSAVTESPE